MQKSEQQSRLRFIEFILYWQGHIQNKQLVAQFGVSRQQAWQDLQRYAELVPQNLQPLEQSKPYQAADNLQPTLFTPDIDHYLRWVQNPACFEQPGEATPGNSATLQLPPRQVSAGLIRLLVQALREQQRVEVDYVCLPHARGGVSTSRHTRASGFWSSPA